MTTRLVIALGWLLLPVLTATAQRSAAVQSPDKNIRVEITTAPALSYRVLFKNQEVMGRSAIKLQLDNGTVLGEAMRVSKAERKSVNETIRPLFGIRSEYANTYNQLTLQTGQNYAVEFRVFNDAVSYRFVTRFPGNIRVKDEVVEANFPQNPKAYFHKVPEIQHSYEQNYTYAPVTALDSNALTALPILVEAANARLLYTEADLYDYPGLHLSGNGSTVLRGKLAPIVKETKLSGWEATDYNNNKRFVNYNQLASAREDFLAETRGERTFPWRVLVIKEEVKDLMNTPVVYLLARDNQIGDPSWIKPGKVVWDWWNAVNLSGVDFKAGYNTETFKHYIDFAARNNMPYVNLDEWWSDQDNLLKVSDKLDMEELTRYAKEKNVGLFLWCIWHVLDRQMEPALDQFKRWNIAGIKVDFMDRDDQYAVNFYERTAAEAAKRQILVNFHGAMKPTGQERTYPNVINREAVLGLEYNKFSERCTPEHSVTIPFIRMAVGPMDYTPGAMYNGTKDNWRQVFLRPMSMSTRAQQLAMFVVYYAPLQMLADAPTEYEKEPAILQFLSEVPVTWDETVPLAGEPGQFVAIARRKGQQWYIGVLNNSEARTIEIPTRSFLPNGNYALRSFADGVNADRLATDYRHETKKLSAGETLKITLAPGGGWVGVVGRE